MQLTLHATRLAPHGASRLVNAVSAWSVKTRRAPSRHYRAARVYGHTPTAMHDTQYTPPPSPPHLLLFFHSLSALACHLRCTGLFQWRALCAPCPASLARPQKVYHGAEKLPYYTVDFHMEYAMACRKRSRAQREEDAHILW